MSNTSNAFEQTRPIDCTPPITFIADLLTSSACSTDDILRDAQFMAEMGDFFLHPELQSGLDYHFSPTFFEQCALMGLPIEQFKAGPSTLSTASTSSSLIQCNLNLFGARSLGSRLRLALGGNYQLPYQPLPSDAPSIQYQDDLCIEDFMTAFTPDLIPFIPGASGDVHLPTFLQETPTLY